MRFEGTQRTDPKLKEKSKTLLQRNLPKVLSQLTNFEIPFMDAMVLRQARYHGVALFFGK